MSRSASRRLEYAATEVGQLTKSVPHPDHFTILLQELISQRPRSSSRTRGGQDHALPRFQGVGRCYEAFVLECAIQMKGLADFSRPRFSTINGQGDPTVECEAGVAMIKSSTPKTSSADRITASPRLLTFRRIWLASVLANLGALIRSVGAAWAMMQMTSSAEGRVGADRSDVAGHAYLDAGAIADMYDRRIAALVSVSIATVGAATLTALACLDLVTPNLLRALCFVVGSGMALMDPAWQSSVSEQVPLENPPGGGDAEQ